MKNKRPIYLYYHLLRSFNWKVR